MNLLTEREQQVHSLIVAGKANKVIADDLGLSQRTVEIHRSRVMEKTGVRSLAELVHNQYLPMIAECHSLLDRASELSVFKRQAW